MDTVDGRFSASIHACRRFSFAGARRAISVSKTQPVEECSHACRSSHDVVARFTTRTRLQKLKPDCQKLPRHLILELPAKKGALIL